MLQHLIGCNGFAFRHREDGWLGCILPIGEQIWIYLSASLGYFPHPLSCCGRVGKQKNQRVLPVDYH